MLFPRDMVYSFCVYFLYEVHEPRSYCKTWKFWVQENFVGPTQRWNPRNFPAQNRSHYNVLLSSFQKSTKLSCKNCVQTPEIHEIFLHKYFLLYSTSLSTQNLSPESPLVLDLLLVSNTCPQSAMLGQDKGLHDGHHIRKQKYNSELEWEVLVNIWIVCNDITQ